MGVSNIKQFLENLKKKMKADKKLTVIVAAGLIGIILLTFSQLHSSENKNDTSSSSSTKSSQTSSVQDYTSSLEKKLTSIISNIDGAGRTQVMITLDCSDENVYALEEKSSTSDSSSSYENEYVIVDSDNSEKKGVLIKVVEPKIRGVAIVCDGGNSSVVQQNIIKAVTAVLDISSSKVSISKIKNQ